MATTTLNPNAPMFVPMSYRQVEDFSDEWWTLVSSSPWFRDYWLRECFQDPALLSDAAADTGTGTDDSPIPNSKTTKNQGGRLDLASLGLLKWRKPAEIMAKTTKNGGEKAPKIVNVKGNPRPIKQPR